MMDHNNDLIFGEHKCVYGRLLTSVELWFEYISSAWVSYELGLVLGPLWVYDLLLDPNDTGSDSWTGYGTR